MYIDTHLHLDEPWLTDEKLRQKTIQDITENKIVTWAQACDLSGYQKIIEWSKMSEYIFPSFGILPWYANEWMDKLDEVARYCEDAIMFGEIGLDEGSSRNTASKKEQEALFEVFLEVAEKNNMIMNCHFRGGLEERGLELLNSYEIKKGIFHHYSGPPKMIEKINDNGHYISYGSSKYVNISKALKGYLAKRVPKVNDDFLIIEIDVLHREEDYKPPSAVIPKILEVLAEAKKTTSEEIETMNQRNVLRMIGDDPKLKEMRDLLS
ncbi:MAG: hypothetical protein HGN29_12765 [Asgard group archaeon]|nr:hypothetical protein [Asgard group archaeon]